MMLTSATLSSQPGVAHGFTTRAGGVSTGALASLNLAMRPDESEGAVAENWRRVTASLGFAPSGLALVTQVHGDAVHTADQGAGPLDPQAEADAVVTTRPGVLAAVRVADCVPVLLAGPGVVAAVHAGWRGTALGVVEAAARVACALAGCPPEALHAAIGPCIGPCCYEVGEEVAEAVSARVGDAALDRRRGPRPHVDLALANQRMLQAMGLRQVDLLRVCTACSPQQFSHRRDGARTGRSAGVIGLRA